MLGMMPLMARIGFGYKPAYAQESNAKSIKPNIEVIVDKIKETNKINGRLMQYHTKEGIDYNMMIKPKGVEIQGLKVPVDKNKEAFILMDYEHVFVDYPPYGNADDGYWIMSGDGKLFSRFEKGNVFEWDQQEYKSTIRYLESKRIKPIN